MQCPKKGTAGEFFKALKRRHITVGFSDEQLQAIVAAAERVAYQQRNRFLRSLAGEVARHRLECGESDVSDVSLSAAIEATLPRFMATA